MRLNSNEQYSWFDAGASILERPSISDLFLPTILPLRRAFLPKGKGSHPVSSTLGASHTPPASNSSVGAINRAGTPPALDAGTTYVDCRVLLTRIQSLLDSDSRQALAALGLLALVLTGFGAWRTQRHIKATRTTLAKATGISLAALTRSLELLVAAGLLIPETTGWRIDGRLLPAGRGRRMASGARAIPLVHREIWAIRRRLSIRSDVTAYHDLRDLGAHILSLAQIECRSELRCRHDRRTALHRQVRLVAAGLRSLSLEIPRHLAPTREDNGTSGLPPGWRERWGVPRTAPPNLA